MIKYKGSSCRCIDFARSSGGRKPTNPAEKAGGIVFVAFAKDAITWAARSAAKGGTDAPATMNLAQLKAVYRLQGHQLVTGQQEPGPGLAIKVYLPPPGSGTLSPWEKFMGITALGSCVSQAPEENEGTNPVFKSANAIGIYSIGAYVAQKYHSGACGAKPSKAQNQFGCNTTGVLALGKIGGVAPLTAAKVPVINPAFPSSYFRTVYNIPAVGRVDKDHIDARLEKFFSSKALKGYLCTSPTAKTAAIRSYGFIPTPLCGSIS